jgi:NAD(P)-dependent dehydrogenase (short-subunit alcohol dehydrogenase family)
VAEAVSVAREAFGGLDVVVANAGIGFGGAAADVDDERWERTFDVNVTGAFRLIRAALPSLLERGKGSIVVVSSVSALVSGTEGAAYQASKAALLGLTRSLAVDYGPRGIRANALLPGWVITEMGDRAMESLIGEDATSARRPTAS